MPDYCETCRHWKRHADFIEYGTCDVIPAMKAGRMVEVALVAAQSPCRYDPPEYSPSDAAIAEMN